MSKYSQVGTNSSGLGSAIRRALVSLGVVTLSAPPAPLNPLNTPATPSFTRGPSSYYPQSRPVCTKKAWKDRRKQSSKKYKKLR